MVTDVFFQLGLSDIKTRDYLDWILKHPGQVVLTVSQVIYTREVNQTFDSETTDVDSALVQIRDQMITTINQVCSLVFVQLESTKLLTVEALLTLQVHWRDIFEMLIRHHVGEVTCFALELCLTDSRKTRLRMAKTSALRLERERNELSNPSSRCQFSLRL